MNGYFRLTEVNIRCLQAILNINKTESLTIYSTVTVHSASLSSGERDHLRECTWCVLGGTGHQWLYINLYRLVEHSL